MSIFERIGHALSSFFGSPQARAVEKEVAVAAVPLVEKALVGLAGANPIAGAVVVSIVEPVIAEESAKAEEPRPSTAP
jgi:hypothetical protein